MDSLWQDVRYALRGLRNQPAFAALAVLTLALGIGAATTIYSVIYNVLFDPFPYKDANKVVALQIRNADRPTQSGRNMFQTPEFLDYQTESKVFQDVIAGTFEDVLYTTKEGTELLQGGLVSTNMFDFLGVPAAVGRALTADDARPGAPPVFVMSYKTWRKYFNLDVGILGQTFMLNGIPTTLVGMMPPRFTKLNADIYKPIVLDRADARLNQEYFMFQARLKPGITTQQAETELTVIARRLAQVYPRNYPTDGKFIVKIVSWVDNVIGGFRGTLYTFAAAVGLLLFIACSNVANMLLARGASREKEMAIRASLGASRFALIRQLLIESLLLALGGMLVGWLFAYVGLTLLTRAIPEGSIPHEAVIRLNVPVLLASLGVAGLTAIVFGLVPALQTVRSDLVEPLKDARKGSGGGFRRGKLRKALVIFEVALSLVLLVGAGLLMRSFVKRTTVDLGFDPQNVLVARLPLPRGQYQDGAKKVQFFRQLLPRLQALPGVTAVTTVSSLPPFGGGRSEIDIPGKERTAERWESMFDLCSEGYFQTLGLRLLRGRLLSEQDVNDARKVIVVNQAFVNRYFGREDPIGRQINFKRLEALPEGKVEHPVFEIIGVVSDAKNRGIEEPVFPGAFMPYGVTGAFERGVLLRTAVDPPSLLNSLRREIWAVDRGIAITMTDTLASFLRQFAYAQ
ncbi:MAG TPA: ADOP family duplicated permease, partial [Opitutaceae bacterium]|nr:ADOP family duplicated permease [Opitutaceae bacterium]